MEYDPVANYKVHTRDKRREGVNPFFSYNTSGQRLMDVHVGNGFSKQSHR